jgi:magnesium chelatase subunit I
MMPLCKRCRDLIAEKGDATPIAYLTRDERYVEKLATPDVTVADLIGDLDPIKAARGGQDLVERADHALRAAASGEPRDFLD